MDLRVAIVGLGNMGRKHIKALQSIQVPALNIMVTAVSDVRSDLMVRARRDFGVECGLEDWRTLVVSPDIDVIHVCTPNMSHFNISHEALVNNKHVVSEKPLALTTSETAALRGLASANHLIGALNHTYRGYEAVQLARRLVHDGELGIVNVIRGGYLQDWLLSPQTWDWRIDPALVGPSRAVADIGTHWIDLAAYITGQRMRRLISDLHVVMPVRQVADAGDGASRQVKRSARPVITEDYASVLFHTDDARGAFTVSQVSSGHQNSLWLEVDGSTGSLHWSSDEPDRLELRRGSERSRVSVSTTPGEEPGQAGADANTHALRRVFTSAYAAMHGLDPSPTGNSLHATFDDGHYAAQVLETVLESARTGSWVDLSQTSPQPLDVGRQAAVHGSGRR